MLKFGKDRKGSIKGLKQQNLSFGSYGLKALSIQRHLKASHSEAVRRVLIRRIRKIGHISLRARPYKSVSGKPTKTRMGKGKGSIRYWVCPIKPGQILIEINGGISEQTARDILIKASKKLPVKTKFVKKLC